MASWVHYKAGTYLVAAHSVVDVNEQVWSLIRTVVGVSTVPSCREAANEEDLDDGIDGRHSK